MFVFMLSVYHGDFRAPAMALAGARKHVLPHFVARKSSTRGSRPERQRRPPNVAVEERVRAKRAAHPKPWVRNIAPERNKAVPSAFIRPGADGREPTRPRVEVLPVRSAPTRS